MARRTFKMSAAFVTLRASASMISVLIKSPGWGGFFMGIKGLLMVVEQVDVFEGVCGFVEVENQAPESLWFAL